MSNIAHKLVFNLRKLRRKGFIGETVSISMDNLRFMVNISTDEGRLARPLIIVENGKSKLTVGVMEDILNKKKSFFDLVKEGILEYLDVVFSS